MRWKTTEYSGWGRVFKAKGDMARPEKVSEMQALIAEGASPAIGNRRSYGDTALNSDGRVTDMTRLDRFISFDAETGLLEAEAGATISDILAVFGPKGWMPAVMPGTGFATLGGCIAADVHGKNHHIAGSFGQHVDSILLIGADGKPHRISATAKPQLFKATIGGMGQTGVILTARIHLAKCSGGTMLVNEKRMANVGAFFDAFAESSAPYQVGWVDTTANGDDLGRGILEEAQLSDGPFRKPRKNRSIPFNAPRFAMSKPIVKMFNNMYLRRVPAKGREKQRQMADFFFPLDRIHNWNRLYGKSGFHQFQCVLPDNMSRSAVTQILEEVSKSGLCSPLSVLKRMGPGRAGMMSFPMAGMTLAVDIANKGKSVKLLEKLNGIALNAKGRVYLAKDSSLEPAVLKMMYPELGNFQKVLHLADPDKKFETDQARRLNIRGQS